MSGVFGSDFCEAIVAPFFIFLLIVGLVLLTMAFPYLLFKILVVIVAIFVLLIGGCIFHTNSRIHSADENHTRIKRFAESAFETCSAGASGVKMMTRKGTRREQVLRPCSGPESTSRFFAKYIAEHFTATGCTNPYGRQSCAVAGSYPGPKIGQTHLVGLTIGTEFFQQDHYERFWRALADEGAIVLPGRVRTDRVLPPLSRVVSEEHIASRNDLFIITTINDPDEIRDSVTKLLAFDRIGRE